MLSVQSVSDALTIRFSNSGKRSECEGWQDPAQLEDDGLSQEGHRLLPVPSWALATNRQSILTALYSTPRNRVLCLT